MKNIPVNRWTVSVVVILTLIFGNDVVAPIFKAIGIMTSPYVPAV